MRFAFITTAAAAVVAAPFALSAAGPQMTSGEFLSAVRCAAYEDVSGVPVADAKYRLNAESQRQPSDAVVAAEAEVSAIALQAVNSQTAADQAILRAERTAACSQSQLAAGADGSNAV